jgi:hypothetical protein
MQMNKEPAKPIVYQFPDHEVVVFTPGDLYVREHFKPMYLFPIGTIVARTKVFPFACGHCGKAVRWALLKRKVLVASCHCCGLIVGTEHQELLTEQFWTELISDHRCRQEIARLHAN